MADTGHGGRINPTLLSGSEEVKVQEPAWDQWFSEHTQGRAGPFRVLRGKLAGGTGEALPGPLEEWADQVHLHRMEGATDVVAIRRVEAPVPDRHLLHLALFLAALASATVAGGFLEGVDALTTRFTNIGGTWVPVPTDVHLGRLGVGLPFAIAFIGILLGHELGHYLAAKRHGIPVSLPYFIPFPPYFSIVGTLGAFIRLRGPMVKRSVLFDVGVAGPFASFLLSLPVLIVGLRMSDVVAGGGSQVHPFMIQFLGEPMRVGTGPLLDLLTAASVPGFESGSTVALHPLAFAGWLGIFVTALNLLPLGQLDGGHVLYALLGRGQRWLGWGFVVLMVPLGFVWWGWWVWGGIAVMVSRGRVAHPPVLMDDVAMGKGRRALAVIAIAIFVISFSPAPLRL